MSTSHQELAEYLKPLLSPTPGGLAMLQAAWDGLSQESQIALLAELESRCHSHPNDRAIRIRALDSPHPYVRYLAARNLEFLNTQDAAEGALRKRLEEDPSGLVRSSLCEDHGSFGWIVDKTLRDPKVFFRLSQEIRLARMRRGAYGKAVAELIEHALAHELKDGLVSEAELYDLLSEFLNSETTASKFRKRVPSWDGGIEDTRRSNLEGLWRLVPKVPKAIGFLLVSHLPDSTSTWGGTHIPREVLDAMDPQHLEWLLRRPDICLSEFRRSLFLDSPTASRDLKSAAIAHYCDLSNVEFGQILSKAPEERLPLLAALADARHLRPCLYRAIYDCLEKQSDIAGVDVGEIRHSAWRALQNSLRMFKDRGGERVLELKVYCAAKRAVPWNKGETALMRDELKGLDKCLVQEDTWATFNSLWEEGYRRWQTPGIQKLFPRLLELEEIERAEASSPAEKGQLEDLAEQIRASLREDAEQRSAIARSLQESMRDMLKEQRTFFETRLNSLETSFLDILRTVDGRLHSVRTGLNRFEVRLWLLLAILAWLLFTGYFRK